jgi:hypothetical protein
MINTLQMVLDKQAEFQKKFGFEGLEQTDIETVSSLIHTHSHFTMEELFEMERELPYHKPWKDYSGLTKYEVIENFQKGREEWIDAFIFLMNVGLFLGFDSKLIEQMYLEKLGINHKRQEDPKLGYITEVN